MAEESSHHDPVVSVVMIFLNEEAYLEEAIDSVLRQTFTDWELILVDDGSNDSSPEIAQRWAVADSRIRYITHPGGDNRGMSASRNLGVHIATGTYVSYLDGDDIWQADKLEVQLADLAQHPQARLTYGPVVSWVSWQEGLTTSDDTLYGLEGDRFTLDADRLYQSPELVRLFLYHKDLVPTGEMFERSLFLDVGGANEDFRGNYEDGVVLTKMLLRADAYCTSTPTYFYRQHPKSSTALDRAAGVSDSRRQDFLTWVAGYLEAEGVTDRGVRTALWRARLPASKPRTDKALRSTLRAVQLARKGAHLGLSQARLAGRRQLISMPVAEITDEFAFGLGPDGWNCYTSILCEVDSDPTITAERSEFARFFASAEVNAVEDLNQLLDLGAKPPRFGATPRFWLGTYPWGSLIDGADDKADAIESSLGPAFGWAYDAASGSDTSLLWGRGRTLWYRPEDEETINNEWRITLQLYEAIRRRYSPLKARGFPRVTVLERDGGERRGIIVDGHHRLAILAHLGRTRAIVEIEKVVRAADVANWVGVRHGACSESEALALFDAFFYLDGSERATAVSDLGKND